MTEGGKLHEIQSRVHLYKEHVEHTSSTDFPFAFPGNESDFSFQLEKFVKNCQIVVGKLEGNDLEFDLIGIDASIANAFRRIMISEVPTIAIENVYMTLNTSIMYDEILSHRLGLIPLKVDPFEFDWKPDQDDATDLNTIVFELDVACTKKANVHADETDPEKKYNHRTVYASDLVWKPHGDQEEKFINNPISIVHDDIVITKLRPGDQIIATCHARKGTGHEHAKWSPVATATYRILPEIQILKPIPEESLEKFQKCFAPGVIDIVSDKNGNKTAKVVNPRKDTVSREVLRHPEFQDKVKLTRIRDHFIYSVESVGALEPDVIFEKSCEVFIEKLKYIKESLNSKGLIRSE